MTQQQNLIGRKWLLRVLMLFSLVFSGFLYGMLASTLKWFPYHSFQNAAVALDALSGVARPPSIDGLLEYRQTVDRPTARWLEVRPSPDCVLLSGGSTAHVSAEYPDGAMAWIVDREGRDLHVWRNHPQLWKDAKTVKTIAGLSGPCNPVGVEMFPNGDLLVTFHGQNTFPFAVGLAKFDRDSNLLWKRELLTHHFFSLADDGHIFVPALEVVDSPVYIHDTEAMIMSPTNKVYVDYVLELDPDGNEINRLNILESLFQAGHHGALVRFNQMFVETDDPTHLNDVRWLSAEEANALPGASRGDLLVSLRNLNALAVIDGQSGLMKWFTSGSTIGQHAPRVHRNGILVFDNLGGDAKLGGTRLVHIDYATRQVECVFPRRAEDMPDKCRSVNCGYLDVHADGQYALMAVTHGGSVWEVDLESGQVVWEYIINDHLQPTQRGKVGLARYVARPDFVVAKDGE